MNLIEEARSRGLVEDLPDGGLRALPEMEHEMPELYQAFRQAKREELEKTVFSMIGEGLLEAHGMRGNEFSFRLTKKGRAQQRRLAGG